MNWTPTNEFRWLWLKPPFDGSHPSAFFPYEGARFAQCLQQKLVSYFEDGDYVDGDISIHAGTVRFEWRDIPIVTEESK